MHGEKIQTIDNLLDELAGVRTTLVEEKQRLKAEHLKDKFANLETTYEFFRDNFAWHISRSLTVEKTVWWSVTGLPYTMAGCNWSKTLKELSGKKHPFRPDTIKEISEQLDLIYDLGTVRLSWGGRQNALLTFIQEHPDFRWIAPTKDVELQGEAVNAKWDEYRQTRDLWCRLGCMERPNVEKKPVTD